MSRFIDPAVAHEVQQLLNKQVEAGGVIDFVYLLTKYNESADLPAIDDQSLKQDVINSLQEHYGYSETAATEAASSISDSAQDAMWSEYSNVLEYES